MKIKLLFLIMVIVFSSCYAHLDKIIYFKISADLYEANTNKPINNVECVFVDTGYDEIRSKKGINTPVGSSDNYGKINKELTILWGITQGLFFEKPKRTFDIQFVNSKYKLYKISFQESNLQEDNNGFYLVNVGKIFLEPIESNK
jgi:hypothetical protein